MEYFLKDVLRRIDRRAPGPAPEGDRRTDDRVRGTLNAAIRENS